MFVWWRKTDPGKRKEARHGPVCWCLGEKRAEQRVAGVGWVVCFQEIVSDLRLVAFASEQ